MSRLSPVVALDPNALTARAQHLGNQAEQDAAHLFLQQITRVALLAQVLYLTQQVVALSAQTALSGMRLAANEVALQAQLKLRQAAGTSQKPVTASPAQVGLMARHKSPERKLENDKVSDCMSPTLAT